MNTVAKGSRAENAVAREMETEGFVVGSRRHIGGSGDLLGIHADGRTKLVEVKERKRPYDGFRPEDRQAMKETKAKLPPGAELWLANRRRGTTEWIAEADWP